MLGDRVKLVIAGGGTGGHLFPGVAIAEELHAREVDAEIVFVGTERGIEARVLPKLGWDLELIQISGLKTVGVLGAIRGAFRIPGALWQSRKLLKKHRPQAVIGVGGYASGPVVLMAKLRGIPTAICEQNTIPGLTNKILGRLVRKVFLAFEESRRFFQPKKIVMSGNPVRRGLVAALAAAPATNEVPRVFICGGSLGATKVNEIASLALCDLAKARKFTVVHQTGAADEETIRTRYREGGVSAEVHAFIDQMAQQYLQADVIRRSSSRTRSPPTTTRR